MIRLWNGKYPLRRAFWEFAILYGGMANLAATVASMALIASGFSVVIAAIVFLLPVPYLIVATVGVWRSTRHYDGPAHLAAWARPAVVAWTIAMVLL